MAGGSLVIGNSNGNYGYDTSGFNSGVNGTAGLLMECIDYTELVVHDYSTGIKSFMTYYNNHFQIGRNAGQGTSTLTVVAALAIGGNYAPTYTLEIPDNGTGNSGAQNLRYFNYDTNITASNTTLVNVSDRIGGSLWVGSWIASSSDTRIKEDIQGINDDIGNKIVYGFIAQQIKEVLPDAVGIEPNYIPNIMLLADYDNDIITLPSQPTKVIIKLNDKIRCYDKDNKLIDVIVIEIIDELTFKIKFNDNEPVRAKEPTINIDTNSINISLPEGSGAPLGLNIDVNSSNIHIDVNSSNINIDANSSNISSSNINISKFTDNKIFVSGTEVDGFHTISKEYIFTLNVCATQELHRRIISQEERIKELELKMTDILKYLSL